MKIGILIKYLKPYRIRCIIAPAFKLFEAILELYMPLRLAGVVDTVLSMRVPDKGYIIKEGAILLCIVALGFCCALVCQYTACFISQGYGTALRSAVFKRICEFSSADTAKFGKMSLVNRVINDTDALQSAVAYLIRLVIRAPFLCIGGIVMSFIINPRLAFVIVGAIAVFVYALIRMMKINIPRQKELRKSSDNMSSGLSENIAGIRTVRAFSKEDSEKERFFDSSEQYKKSTVLAGWAGALLNPLTQLIMNCAIVAVLVLGGIYKSSAVSCGDIIALINYANQILLALIVVSNLFLVFNRAYAAGTRICEVLDTNPSINEGSVERGTFAKNIVQFDNVSFSYGGEKVLENLSFDIERGSVVGIIGGTGSGKTTIVNLITRLYDCQEGQVLFDGVNIKYYRFGQIRSRISAVLQKSNLFSGTVRSNIVMNKDFGEANLMLSAHIACADSFIKERDGGYDAVIERGGMNFSGGQKQRLAIARAIAARSELLILDDAYSALDYATEREVRDGILSYYKKKTLIIVSQRATSVKNCNKIFVLDNGKIVGTGKHSELVQNCEIYKSICALQGITEDDE